MYGDFGLEENLPDLVAITKLGGLIAVAGTLNPGQILGQKGIKILINERNYAFALPGGHYIYTVGRK